MIGILKDDSHFILTKSSPLSEVSSFSSMAGNDTVVLIDLLNKEGTRKKKGLALQFATNADSRLFLSRLQETKKSFEQHVDEVLLAMEDEDCSQLSVALLNVKRFGMSHYLAGHRRGILRRDAETVLEILKV